MNTGEKLEVIADAVYEKGKEDTIKTLWDAITNKGKKTVGTRMFNECDFTEIQELPYVWKCTSGNMSQMFYNYQGKKLPNPEYVDLSYLPENNTSLYTNSLCAWYSSTNIGGVTDAVFPDYGIPAPNSCESWFSHATALGTIEVLRVHKSTTFKSTFATNSGFFLNLVNITFEGEIGQDLDMSKCPKLSAESLDNIVSHLYDYSTEAPNTHTLMLHADCWTDELKARVEALGWKTA